MHATEPAWAIALTSARPRRTYWIALAITVTLVFALEGIARDLTRYPEYLDEAARALGSTLVSPLAGLLPAPILWLLSRPIAGRRASFQSAVVTGIAATAWVGAAMAASWIFSAFANTSVVAMVAGAPLALAGVAWCYGHFLKDAEDGRAIGVHAGARMLGYILAFILGIALLVSAVFVAVIAWSASQ